MFVYLFVFIMKIFALFGKHLSCIFPHFFLLLKNFKPIVKLKE